MRGIALTTLVVASVMLPGCLAKTAVDIVTLPVKAASKGVDLATTSQSEADEKRGREIRNREAELAKLDRTFQKQNKDCAAGDERQCDAARTTYDQMQELMRSIPVEPGR